MPNRKMPIELLMLFVSVYVLVALGQRASELLECLLSVSAIAVE